MNVLIVVVYYLRQVRHPPLVFAGCSEPADDGLHCAILALNTALTEGSACQSGDVLDLILAQQSLERGGNELGTVVGLQQSRLLGL